MIKKFVFVVLAAFGFSSVADMHSGMDHMSDMADSEGGMSGSIWIKYKALGEYQGADSLNYRARLGWTGDLNEAVQWGVAVSSSADGQSFYTPALFSVTDEDHKSYFKLEQAYVSWVPVDGLSFSAGKKAWDTSFNKTGVLYDEDLYPEGFSIKYSQSIGNGNGIFAKLCTYNLDEAYSGPLEAGTTLTGVLAGSFAVADGIVGDLYVSATHDGLLKDASHTAITLAKVGVQLSTSNRSIPAGLFGAYVSDTEDFGAQHSFTGGVYVGSVGTVGPGEMGEFGLAVSYYDLTASDYNSTLLNTDYVKKGAASLKGVAVRAQYNVWTNTNLVAKFAHDLDGGDDANNLIGELNVNF